MTRIQDAIYLAATTMHIWRDAAIAILAGIAILGIYLFVEAQR